MVCAATILILIVIGAPAVVWLVREVTSLDCLENLDYWIDDDESDHIITKI